MREPAGIPTGGQFAAGARTEADVDLTSLSAMTPGQVDTELADLHTELSTVQHEVSKTIAHVHRLDGQRPPVGSEAARRRLPNGGWDTDHATALTSLREKYDTGQVKAWDEQMVRDALEKVDTLAARQIDLTEKISEREAEYRSRPWPRFFLVTSSQGHIHSSMECSTCRPDTKFGWMPQLSGKSEQDAVAEKGAILCTVCYPSAPTEWTNGARPGQVDESCAGSGQKAAEDSVKQFGRAKYGTCPVCSEQIQVNLYRVVRKHKTKG